MRQFRDRVAVVNILPQPEEALDMAEQQLRWMRDNIPLVPGPGVARTAD
jgi:hypothetical protein